ncbi:protein SUPPRESSOR OF npr1-1, CONSTITUTIVE 1-like [Prunus avium]|uniref:Protein SUPPRESSOR OF npr1-1, CONSTITUTIVE 1-like n=1 Tax=Prunus avium TaxID=42229 RepID=A0A6P5TFN2_PRUAV|nr:protein SUPPRESSOR OF npr1-1, CONSTITUTIVE 1-like [Prunus avium]
MDARKAHKASSSSSPSSSSKRWKYQVFLSFRGEDTRKGFTGHLHAALSDAGISTFLDDNELERAEFIKTQLEQAINGSMISIIVFSKSYADSAWCLDELVKIMECRERLGQQVIPLFYNVDASDVRKQTGCFAQAFEKHEAGICEGKHEKEKVQRWRNALTQAADLCGEDLKNADNGKISRSVSLKATFLEFSRSNGTKKIEGVALHCSYMTRFSAQAFTSMQKLRLLHLSDVELTGEYKDFPKKLMWLSWEGFPLESIPDDFPMQPKLVALDLQYSGLKIVWKDCKLHQNLKILNLSYSLVLTKSPDFSKLPNLEELILEGCKSLSKVHSSIGDLGRLSLVNLEDCQNLRAIPDLPTNLKGLHCLFPKIPSSWHTPICTQLLSSPLVTEPASKSHFYEEIYMSQPEGFKVAGKENWDLWQGQLSNDELKLQDGDKVLIEIIVEDYYDSRDVKVKKTGVSLVWDKFMNENMINYHLCAYERRPYQNLVNDDDIMYVENDNHITKSPDFSKFPNLEKLILKGCVNLSKVHSSTGDLGRLTLVNLEGCRMLEDLPLNFYKSKSIETLILNGCWTFENLAEGLGDMVSLTILEADNTCIRQIPSSIVKLKKLRILSLSGCWLTEDAIPKDLCSLISLEDLLLGDNDFCSLPSLSGLSKLKVLCVNACTSLRAIPNLPTNLYALKAINCPELKRMPDFSKMWNMRELYLSDSFKLTEVPGLDKSLNSMTRIHMEGCTNLTADFRNNILQRWTSCGFGGIYLNGIYDIPEWFKIVGDVGNIVFFEVPQKIMGRDLKGLTICFVYSYFVFGPKLEDSECPIGIIVRNLTKQTDLHAKIAFARYRRPFSNEPEDLCHGQLSNDVLRLQGGDQVSILVRPLVDFVMVKKTGVHLEWDKVMKENMDNPDPDLYDWETNGDF